MAGGGYAAVGFFYLFHLVTILTITISFAPHLVAMTSFLPLEQVRLGPGRRPRADRRVARPRRRPLRRRQRGDHTIAAASGGDHADGAVHSSALGGGAVLRAAAGR